MTDLMSDYQSTIALKRIFKKQRSTVDSGPEIQFNIITDTNDSARHVPLGFVTNPDIKNVLAVGKMPWRGTTWHWAMEEQLIQMNSGASKILDMVKVQRMAGLGSAIKLFEDTLWRCPAAADFELNPVGIPYFVVKSATDALTDTTAKGFNGSVPSGYTLVANLDPTTTASGRWKNYADAYTAVTPDDLIKRMRRAMFYTDFTPLVDGADNNDGASELGVYTRYSVTQQIEDILRDQNDDIGGDAAAYDGKAMVRRTKVTPVIQLDNDTTDPVYILNWGSMGVKGLKNFWMKEMPFRGADNPNQPTMMFTQTICRWNLFCTNRRKQAVLSTGTTMPA
jgi:hypothetical protein